jgi:hypothetical protein
MTSVITTFSKDGYNLYGHKMISTWIKYWPKEFKLIVYTENFNIEEKDIRITEIPLLEVCPNLSLFKEKSRQLINQKRSRIDKTIKWCHKVYAIQHALSSNDDYLIFLDGDTYTKSNVNASISEQLVRDFLFAVHFERLKDGLHFETGLVCFNLRHPKKEWLRTILTEAYDSLEIYNMKKTWDGYWFAHLYHKYSLPVRNLSENCLGVFCNPLIKNVIVHDVGTNKYRNAGYNKFTGRKIDA